MFGDHLHDISQIHQCILYKLLTYTVLCISFLLSHLLGIFSLISFRLPGKKKTKTFSITKCTFFNLHQVRPGLKVGKCDLSQSYYLSIVCYLKKQFENNIGDVKIFFAWFLYYWKTQQHHFRLTSLFPSLRMDWQWASSQPSKQSLVLLCHKIWLHDWFPLTGWLENYTLEMHASIWKLNAFSEHSFDKRLHDWKHGLNF